MVTLQVRNSESIKFHLQKAYELGRDEMLKKVELFLIGKDIDINEFNRLD